MAKKSTKLAKKGKRRALTDQLQVVDPAIMNGANGKIPVMKFVEAAVYGLRKPEHSGIHVVFSGFNQSFLEYYGVHSRPYLDQLAAEGKIEKVLVVRGPIINLSGKAPRGKRVKSANAVSPTLARVLASVK